MNNKSSNIFDLLGISTNENMHSRFIVSVIESGDYAKSEFIKMLNEKWTYDNSIEPNLKCKARNERVLPDGLGRVDIFISDKYGGNEGKTRIIIENKIFAGDQPHQMARYSQFLEKYNGYLFYLTLEKKDPSLNSLTDPDTGERITDFKNISYFDILKWIKKVKKNVLDKKFKTYLSDYIEIVERLTLVSSLIKEGYQNNDKVPEEDFNAMLELRFWQYIEDKICIDSNTPDNKRRYSYEKIHKKHYQLKRDSSFHDYGIIVNGIRIAVSSKKGDFSIYWSKGKFIEDRWSGDKIYTFNEEKLSTNDLRNLTHMEVVADKIINEYNIIKLKES